MAQTSLPEKFTEYTRQLFGDELWQSYISSFDEPVPVSIRLNSGTTVEQLPHLPLESRIPWSENGYYLSERPQFTLDPLLHAGAYYVQEASSQYLDHVLREVQSLAPQNHENAFWLDLCAAPGGKSLILKDYLPESATLIANEYIRKRAWILAENIAKSSCANEDGSRAERNKILVTNNSSDEIADSGLSFDLILCDVPCSGEGMFRKDRATIDEWSEENVQKCAALQRTIVENAWNCLNDGGILIYSTCTFNSYEDEDNMRYIEQRLGAEIVVPARKFIPGKDRGEGQFMAAFRKPFSSASHDEFPSISNSKKKAGKNQKAEKRLQKALSRLNFMELPQNHKGEPQTPECELSLDDALNYLRGQSLVLPAGTPRGLVAVKYNGHRLGLVKNIGSRANNLYPSEWRIKHL